MIRVKLAVFLSMFLIAVPAVTVVAVPQPAYACDGDSLFMIPAWYQGLQEGCGNIKEIGNTDGDLQNFVVRVALNITKAAFVIAGYAAVFFIIKGGYSYMLARGEPGNITSAKQTIANAITGLIICILAAAIVTAIASVI